MNHVRVNSPKDKLVDFCRRHHIRKLALFRSVLRDDLQDRSHVDVLVEFEPGSRSAAVLDTAIRKAIAK